MARSTREQFRRAAGRIRRLEREIAAGTPPSLRQIGEEIMADAKASSPGRGVPVDTGALRSTGTVEGPMPDKTVILSFGGVAAGYALIQHERLDYRHNVGEPRYLTRAVGRWQPGGSSAIRGMQLMVKHAVRMARATVT